MKNNLVKFSTIAILATFLLSSFPFYSAVAATTRIYVTPQNNIYTIDTAGVGTKFNVTIWVENAPNVGGAQANVEFNDTILRVTRWFEPRNDPQYIFYGRTTSALPSPPDPGYLHLGPNRGRVLISVSLFPPNPPYFTGNGIICIFEFNITKVPTDPGKFTSALTINAGETFLLDGDTGNEVPGVVKTNGYYEISKPGPKYTLAITATSGGTTNPIPGNYLYELGTPVSVSALPAVNYALDHWELDTVNAGSANPITVTMNANHDLHAVFVFSPPVGSRIFVDPPEIIDPHAIPCQTNFQINVSIDDIADMKTCEFNLTYDTNIISIIGLNFLKVNGQYPSLTLYADDPAGFIWVKLVYSTAITVSNPTPLVTLIFHVDNLGATPLDLTETQLEDGAGNPIPHDTYDGFFMAQIRDVAVTNVVPSRTWAYPGWPINVTVTVKNKGNISETFNVYAYYGTTVIGFTAVTALAPNEERDVLIPWDTTGVPEGNYTLKAVADTVPYEMNTADNTFIDGIVWIMTHIHDVAVVQVTLSDSWAFQGWIVKINVTAQNMGDFTESFDVMAYYNTTVIGTIHVPTLAPGSSYIAQFDLDTTSLPPCHTQTISGEATAVPYEFNLTNNALVDGGLKIRWLGDLDGDGKVDLRDVYRVGQAFGSYPGHPRWDPVCDVNRDGKVDLKDVFAVQRNYGKGC
jgi:hypothetical protein